MKMKSLKMKLGQEAYPIVIGDKILDILKEHIDQKTSSIIVISDEKLKHKRQELMRALKKLSSSVIEIPVKAGEPLKDIKSIYPLYGKLLEAKADRDSLLIAFGGGSVGDAAGFVAATYLRGIKWIGIPTTLLAQVDSAVGGKTGINHQAGKNLIGAFHQPKLVVCDVNYLRSLGPREKISGVGEIVKYALAFDKKFFKFLDKNLPLILKGDSAALTKAIETSLRWKCECVSQDVYDRLGPREVLNFGHTFGHALESSTKYKKYQHGEAVIWGMRFALALSEIRGHLSSKKRLQMEDFLKRLEVPAIPRSISKSEIFSHMKKDKKSQGQKIRFVLLDDIGHSVSDKEVTKADLDQAFHAITGREV